MHTPPAGTSDDTMHERPILYSGPMVRATLEDLKNQTRRVVKSPGMAHEGYDARADEYLRCPYGAPGDRLYVRERHSLHQIGDAKYACFPDGSQKFESGAYAPDLDPDGEKHWPEGHRWRPSIHMPRWASRLTLEITEVRLERLQDISEADAIAEGVSPGHLRRADTGESVLARPRFRDLWDSINGRRPGCSWDDNPWVWVITFTKVTP